MIRTVRATSAEVTGTAPAAVDRPTDRRSRDRPNRRRSAAQTARLQGHGGVKAPARRAGRAARRSARSHIRSEARETPAESPRSSLEPRSSPRPGLARAPGVSARQQTGAHERSRVVPAVGAAATRPGTEEGADDHRHEQQSHRPTAPAGADPGVRTHSVPPSRDCRHDAIILAGPSSPVTTSPGRSRAGRSRCPTIVLALLLVHLPPGERNDGDELATRNA